MLKVPSYKKISSLDLLEKLNLLEKIVFENLLNKSNSKKSNTELNFNNSIKLLLEILKLKHKIKPQSNEVNFLSLLNLTNSENNSNS